MARVRADRMGETRTDGGGGVLSRKRHIDTERESSKTGISKKKKEREGGDLLRVSEAAEKKS